MRLVHDIDLVAARGARSVHRALSQIARVIDPSVARRVDLHHVKAGGSRPDPSTRIASAARLSCICLIHDLRAPLAVERHRENACCARLADPPGAGEQIAVRDAVLGHSAGEPSGDVLLCNKVRETGGSMLAGECGMNHVHERLPQATRSDACHRLALLPSRS